MSRRCAVAASVALLVGAVGGFVLAAVTSVKQEERRGYDYEGPDPGL